MSTTPSQRDRMLAGQAYLSGDPELRQERRRCRLLTERLNATSVAEPGERAQILRTLLGAIGDSTEILSPFHCDYGYPRGDHRGRRGHRGRERRHR